jgi:hypothetical protein
MVLAMVVAVLASGPSSEAVCDGDTFPVLVPLQDARAPLASEAVLPSSSEEEISLVEEIFLVLARSCLLQMPKAELALWKRDGP